MNGAKTRLVIKGGTPLSGSYRPSGNKNAALPMLAASVLTDEPVILDNVPLIEDVCAMLAILDDIGVKVEVAGHTVTLRAAGLRKTALDPELCARVRSSILFAGPVAARHGRVRLASPGGDVIGRRRLDTHLEGLAALGIAADCPDRLSFRRRNLRASHILLEEASVTATENILMAAAIAPGRTTIFNAACEPHVQDLCGLLTKMGAHITGCGTNRMCVRGVKRLRGARHRVQPDYIEAGSFIAAAAATGGSLSVRGATGAHLEVIGRAFHKLGVGWWQRAGGLSVPARQRRLILNDYGNATPKIEDGPWPSFPSDLMSVAIVLATQARGTVLFFEKMFESRMYFVDRLIDMGARIIQCDPHRVIVVGPSRLHRTHLASPDIRAGMALVIAALCARGTTVIDNAQTIDRGYERIDEKLRALGAELHREG